MKTSLILLLTANLVGLACAAQTKATITEGPVEASSRRDHTPRKAFSNGYLYAEEAVLLKQGDWLVASAQCRTSIVTVLLYDRKVQKYIKAAEDTAKAQMGVTYLSTLRFQIPRSDSFDVMFAIRYEKKKTDAKSEDDDYDIMASVVKPDTPKLDYMVAVSRAAYPKATPALDFRQRLSYLCSHWTAGFRAMASTPNAQQTNPRTGKVMEYIPDLPVTLLDSMGASLQVLGYGKRLAYFMFTDTMAYPKAKAMYDRLQAQLIAVTDQFKVSNLSQMRRVNELATTYFSLKIPKQKVPFEFWDVREAGTNLQLLPVNLFLYGTKQNARVLVVMGEAGSDVYDIGI